ncbi:MAG: M28 family peptidase [Gemmatimonadetes bacterium]|nr:M28 family peptidase [Gemmatimonadota bacterium]
MLATSRSFRPLRVPTLLASLACAALGPSCRQGPAPALESIMEADLRQDVAALAGDAFRGREAGTLDELRAAAWLVAAARKAGLEPAGEDGSYLQFYPLRRVRTSDASSVDIGGHPLGLWQDVILLSPVDASVEGRLVWVGDTPATDLPAASVRGRPVAALLLPPANPPAPGVRLWERRYTMAAVRERSRALLDLGASAVVLVSDSTTDAAFDLVAAWQKRGQTRGDTVGGVLRPAPEPPVMWIRAAGRAGGSAGQPLVARLSTESFVFPSVNVVAVAKGTDGSLSGEYVLFSAHHDHDGIRWPENGDSIMNGADDNVSACAALLAIGRAFVERPGRRSALFVWHGAEEKGLVGSRWYAAHPTVPEGSIAAVLNADMLARNAPDSAALLGMLPPHRNSTPLVEMALAANRDVSEFQLDTLWDQPSHPEGFYFRSDHAPYAQRRIPSLFYTSLLHADYHTARDEPETLDYGKLLRFTRWMYATGWSVAQADARPTVDEGWEYRR